MFPARSHHKGEFMAKHGKKYLAAAANVDLDKFYNPTEAVKLVKETSYTKFDATVEVHMRMGLDQRMVWESLFGCSSLHRVMAPPTLVTPARILLLMTKKH
jgi:large subunit ribosomal protein L1